MPKENKVYQISRVINNNVIASIDKQDVEIVLMGKGIAFNKKVGDFVNTKDIEKVFVLKGQDKNRYLDIIDNIPAKFLDFAIKIIDMAEKELKITASPIAYIMLADHLNFAVERAQKKLYLKNEMLNEIRNFYKKEFEIGQIAIAQINQEFHTHLPADEAGFIAFHIMNLSKDFNSKESKQRLTLINKVVEVVENYFDFTLDKESIYYERFITHLKFFSVRAFSKKEKQLQENDFVYRMMKVQYPEIAKCVAIVQEYLDYNYQIKVTNEEKGYLIIHINNLLTNSKIVTKKG